MAGRWIGKVEVLGSYAPQLFMLEADQAADAVHLGQITDRSFVAAEYDRWCADWETDRIPRPMFNWLAIHDLHPEAETVALFDDNRTFALLQMIAARRMPVGGVIGDPLLYISFLEVAPAVRRSPHRQFGRSFGSFLLGVACDTSFGASHGGRVGLHATLDAEPFYRSRGFRELDCPNEYHEVYLQIETAEALLLVEKFRRAR